MEVSAIVLAAGEGKRMRSSVHKVLHTVCGRPMIDCVLDALEGAGVERIVAVVDGNDAVIKRIGDRARCAVQDFTKGYGTGAAALCGLGEGVDGAVFVVAGDMPLIRPEELEPLLEAVRAGNACALSYCVADVPRDGRVLLEDGAPTRIVEHKNAVLDPALSAVNTINASIYCFDAKSLRGALAALTPNDVTGEYYLTDVVEMLHRQGKSMTAHEVDADSGAGVNDRVQLAHAEAIMRRRINRAHMLAGVTLIDPERTYIGAGVRIGMDTTVHPGCTLTGTTVIGEGCELLPGCRVADSVVGDGVTIESSVLTEASVGDGTHVGPFAYLRPGARVGREVKVGDFVEIKNATVGDGVKISHLAYVGDADLGRDINVSCGVIFSNYDGKRKHRSTVGDNAFIGCNVNLVAPVNVGQDAYIAAGSTVTVDVPPGALAIARERETIKEGWVEKRRLEGKL